MRLRYPVSHKISPFIREGKVKEGLDVFAGFLALFFIVAL
jgi:hypothetical protein